MPFNAVSAGVCLLAMGLLSQASIAGAQDTQPPTITASVQPSPNANGWNHTPVTVSFTCIDDVEVATCPAPVVVTAETSGQIVSGDAYDTSNNTANASVTVRIDMTPPAVTFTSPSNDTTTPATDIAVTASVTDARSGLGDATCNFASTTIVSDAVGCTVALTKGRNTVIVQTIDLAGNNTSASVRVTRSGTPSVIDISPGTFSMTVGDEREVRLTDDFGATPSTVTWTVSDPAVVEVTTGSEIKFRALDTGTTTVTATAGTLTATADVTVSSGAVLAIGTIATAIAPLPGGFVGDIIFTHKVAGGPDLFLQESDGTNQFLRAIDLQRGELWREAIPAPPCEGCMYSSQFGDVFGGVVFVNEDYPFPQLTRVGGGLAGNWFYRDENYRVGRVAQDYNGVISFAEMKPDGPGTHAPYWLVRLDGATGAVLSRIDLRAAVANGYTNVFTSVGAPVVGTDGRTYLLVCSGEVTTATLDPEQPPVVTSATHTLHLLQVEANGTYSSRELATSNETVGGLPSTWPRTLLVEPQGRLVGINADDYESSTASMWIIGSSSYVTYADANATTLHSINMDGKALLSGATSSAVDLDTRTALWSYSSDSIVAPAENNGAVLDVSGSFVQADATGTTSLPELSALAAGATPYSQGIWVGRLASEDNTGAFVEYVAGAGEPAFFHARRGHLQGHQAPPRLPTCPQDPADPDDQKTRILRAFVRRHVPYQPDCGELTKTLMAVSDYDVGTARQTNTWNVDNSFDWLWLKGSVLDGLYCIVSNYGSVPTMNSGYRAPADQEAIQNGPVHNWNNARHVFGDAADLDTPNGASGDPMYDSLRTIAKATPACGYACVEPRLKTPKHIHIDYRGTCATGW